MSDDPATGLVAASFILLILVGCFVTGGNLIFCGEWTDRACHAKMLKEGR